MKEATRKMITGVKVHYITTERPALRAALTRRHWREGQRVPGETSADSDAAEGCTERETCTQGCAYQKRLARRGRLPGETDVVPRWAARLSDSLELRIITINHYIYIFLTLSSLVSGVYNVNQLVSIFAQSFTS